ncbi:uncharacterized protein LOC116294859 isoform X2 [Actinia tenebrosa]|uniref:Uncharacterized protein LOC116294859 isoform X2 n=1 Tax=Actinia tenebrosa TaxID=6105 RepID=A0A6P8I0J5_ACTTE|nr:uncharacterized protein LOC116294859 isoform X2 [Actinia tenebrosa]
MRSPRAAQVCCDSSLCQHPDCWRLNLQRVREAVWRRNGIESEESSTTRSMNVDQVYLTKEQRLESTDGGLPTLKVVDMFSDLDERINSAPNRQLKQPNLHRRSTLLPSLSPDQSQPTVSPQMPHPSPIISPSARTEYQRKMLWKKQFTNPSRAETSISRESGNTVKVATIGVHEVYEPEELCQEWEEVYVTSAYLVWCPSNKKRKKRKGSSGSSRSSITKPNSNKVIPKDVTEDFVPAAMETIKEIPPKSTKTPTGGQPYSPHKSPANQTNLKHYGMDDLSDLPRPILSGMLKRITQRSNEVTPEQDPRKEPKMASSPTSEPITKTKKLLDGVDLSADFDSVVAKEERASKVRLAVDINSRFTTPAEDEALEKQKEMEKSEKEKQEAEAHPTNVLDLVKKGDYKPAQCKSSRELLRLNSIGVPVEDLPSPKSHHCMSSIPRRLSLGASLEPVNIVPIEGCPTNTPPNEPQATQVAKFDEIKSKKSQKINEFFVDIPHGRASSALERSPYYGEVDRLYVHQSFRNSPSPVRAPAPTPSSPDKYSEFFRQHSRVSQAHRSTSLQEDDMLASMQRWNTLSYVGDTEEPARLEGLAEAPISILRGSPAGRRFVEADKDQDVSEERIFLTEGFEATQDRHNTPDTGFLVDDKRVLKGPPSDTRGRSPSPGSRTRIPKDIIEEFRGNLYGKQLPKEESKAKQKALGSKSREIVLGPKITVSGWRPPRSRTPIPFAETPARFAPRPLKQPPQESVPKSLHIVPIPTQNFQRPRSTPPRITTPKSNYIAQVLSESSLHNTGTSIEVHGPSTNLSDTGSVPPPPSPEALILPNDLNMAVSTLEPLCEEDERSSRTTSIAEFVEKGTGNPRLSPLGGGSEISEESIDLPKELCEDPEDVKEEDDKEVPENQEENDGGSDHNNTKSQVDQDNATDVKQPEQPEEQVQEDEGLNNEKTEDKVQQNDNEVSSTPVPDTIDKNELQATELTQGTDDPLEVTQTFESEEPRPLVSPQAISPRHGSPETAPQPPASPDITSDQDFTEGVDMDLDLTAQLQAAMEGLDDFDLDDDDGDDNVNTRDEDDNINIIENRQDEGDKNSDPIDEENEKNKVHNGDKNHDTNDTDDGKTDSNNDENTDHTIDKENDVNKVDSDDKMIQDVNNDNSDNDESDVAQSNLDKVDQEENYFDRTSPLLEA